MIVLTAWSLQPNLHSAPIFLKLRALDKYR